MERKTKSPHRVWTEFSDDNSISYSRFQNGQEEDAVRKVSLSSGDETSIVERMDDDYVDDYLSKSRKQWPSGPTRLLLNSIEELFPKIGKVAKLKTQRRMWETIKKRFDSHGYEYSVQQIETKYRALMRHFRRVKVHKSRAGRKSSTLQFEDQLRRIFGNKNECVPEYTWSATGDSETQYEILEAANASSASNTSDPIATTPKKLWKRAKKQTSLLTDSCEELNSIVTNHIESQSVSEQETSVLDRFDDDDLDDDESEKRDSWFDEPIRLLLNSMEELAPAVGKTAKLKSRRRMWETIKQRFDSYGYAFTATQIETKFRTLKRQYENAKSDKPKSTRNRYVMPYEEQISRILSSMVEVECVPDYIMSPRRHSETLQELLETDGVSPDNSVNQENIADPLAPTTNTSKRKTNEQISVLTTSCEELKTLITEYIKGQNAYRVRQEKRQERKLALLTEIRNIARKKNEILEKIVDKM